MLERIFGRIDSRWELVSIIKKPSYDISKTV